MAKRKSPTDGEIPAIVRSEPLSPKHHPCQDPIPEDKKKPPKRGMLFCPYCREWRRFKFNDIGYKACPVCGISDREYWVRHHNHTWKD